MKHRSPLSPDALQDHRKLNTQTPSRDLLSILIPPPNRLPSPFRLFPWTSARSHTHHRERIPMNTLLRISVLGLFSVAITTHPAYGDATALPRQGSCPSNYYSSGNYCVPNSGAHPAIPRVGSCPSHYYSSGDYCVANEVGGPHAMPRHGSCPSGYYSSGDYCVANR